MYVRPEAVSRAAGRDGSDGVLGRVVLQAGWRDFAFHSSRQIGDHDRARARLIDNVLYRFVRGRLRSRHGVSVLRLALRSSDGTSGVSVESLSVFAFLFSCFDTRQTTPTAHTQDLVGFAPGSQWQITYGAAYVDPRDRVSVLQHVSQSLHPGDLPARSGVTSSTSTSPLPASTDRSRTCSGIPGRRVCA